MIIRKEDYTPDKGVIQALESIFGTILIGGILRETEKNVLKNNIDMYKQCLGKFKNLFRHNIFRDEYSIFYSIIVDNGIDFFTLDQLKSILDDNRDIINNSDSVDKDRYALCENGNMATDDEIFECIKLDVIDKFKALSNRVVDMAEFNSSCKLYMNWYKNKCMMRISLNMTQIMSEYGYDDKVPGERTRHYQGCDDAQLYYNKYLAVIRSLSGEQRVTSSIVDANWVSSELDKDKKGVDEMELFPYGLDEIDNTLGPLRRGYMVGILGPTKGGKTRFSAYLAGRALDFGYNVAVWPLEGSEEEWKAMETAFIMAHESIAGNGGVIGSNVTFVDSKTILNRKYLNNPILTKQVNAAKLTLAGSGTDIEINEKRIKGSRGRLSFIAGAAYAEDFLDVLLSHYNYENRFDVLIIDSLINILSKGRTGKVERISEAYMRTKSFIANTLPIPAVCIAPAQLKQEVIDALRKNPDDDIEITAGGESAETIRTPDEVIGLFSDKYERRAGIMNIYSVASRHSDSFDNFRAACDLGSCYFASKKE